MFGNRPFLSPDECYVNIGVWEGYTLFAGALGNDTSLCLGIDPYSSTYLLKMWPPDLGWRVRRRYERHAARLELPNIALIQEPWETALSSFATFSQKRIGLLFYDGNHDATPTMAAIAAVVRHMSDSGIVIVDDADSKALTNAVSALIARDPTLHVLMRLPSRSEDAAGWWKGLLIIGRGATPDPSGGGPTIWMGRQR